MNRPAQDRHTRGDDPSGGPWRTTVNVSAELLADTQRDEDSIARTQLKSGGRLGLRAPAKLGAHHQCDNRDWTLESRNDASKVARMHLQHARRRQAFDLLLLRAELKPHA